MAHELDFKSDGTAAMFSVKETPWHKLGTVVANAPNIEEVLKLAGLDWTVSLQQLTLPNGQPSRIKAIVRDDNNKELGNVTGQRWTPLQNDKALEFFRPFVDSGLCTFETAGSLRDGQKVWILAKINSGEMEIVNGDVVRKYLLLSNAHDGKTGIRVAFTPVRCVCANTLAMAHSHAQTKALRLFHSKRVESNLKAVQEIINLANQAFEATAEQYRALAKKQINQDDVKKFVTKVFYNGAQAESDREKIAREKLNQQIENLFHHGYGNSQEGVKGTSWALYNAATQYLAYETGRDQEVRLDSLWFGRGHDLNEKALKIALEL